MLELMLMPVRKFGSILAIRRWIAQERHLTGHGIDAIREGMLAPDVL